MVGFARGELRSTFPGPERHNAGLKSHESNVVLPCFSLRPAIPSSLDHIQVIDAINNFLKPSPLHAYGPPLEIPVIPSTVSESGIRESTAGWLVFGYAVLTD
jgi:hypothetical protein